MLVRRILAGYCLILGIAAHTTFAAGEKTTGQSPKPAQSLAFAMIGGDGYAPFYSYVITPHAIVTKGTVYVAFQNAKGQPIVMAYNTDKKTWSPPAVASTFGLRREAHGNPSIAVDRKGRLHLFYGCHNGPMRHTRTIKPHDITRWKERPPPTPRATYPQSMRLRDGTMCLFYRGGGHKEPWKLRTSADDCRTWSKPRRIIEMRFKPRDPWAGAYACFFPGTDGKTIHCFWNHKDDNAGALNRGRLKKHPWRPLKYKGLHEAVYRYNIYYIRREADGTWVNADGEPISLPVSKVEADVKCLVYDSGDEFAYPERLAGDKDNRPYVRFRTGVQDWRGKKNAIVPMRDWENEKSAIVPMRRKYACIANGAWRITDNMPAAWPAEAVSRLRARGYAAYGERGSQPWFIFYKCREAGGSAIFLYSDKTGYATRKNGPAPCK